MGGLYPVGPRHRSLSGSRARGRVQTSTDNGDTFNRGVDGSGGIEVTGWHDVKGVLGYWADSFGYSSLSEVPASDSIGLLFEAGTADCVGPYSSSGACSIRFAGVPVPEDA